jgi:hypothetical protein
LLKENLYSYCFERENLDKLKELALKENIDISILLMSAYVYLLHKISGEGKVPVYAAINGNKGVNEIVIDMEGIRDFLILFKEVKKSLIDAKLLELQQFKNAIKNELNNTPLITPLFILNGWFSNRSELIKTYGIIVEASLEDNRMNISFEFNNELLVTDRAVQMFKGYLKILLLMMENN